MRVTSGSLRGRRLATCGGRATRPTSSKVREAIFNVLGGRIREATVLDLFAGSGALGIEALSRGAASVVFVDSSVTARRVIGENLRELGLGARGRILGGAVRRAIKSLSQNGEKFHIIFMDPPYRKGMVEESLEAVSEGIILAAEGVVVVERSKRELLCENYGSLRLQTSKRYGDTQISMFGIVSTSLQGEA